MPYIAKEYKVTVDIFFNTKDWPVGSSAPPQDILQISQGEGQIKDGDKHPYIGLNDGKLGVGTFGGGWSERSKRLEAKKWYKVEVSQTLVGGKAS